MDPSARTISEEELLENLAWVQALARKLVRDPGRAEDVAQDAWLNALERPPRGTTGATLRAWLTRVVHTLARQSLRGETSRRRRECAAARSEVVPSTSDVVARTALQQRLVAAVLELDEPERTTVLLRYVDGLSSSAIAARRGETPATVRQRLSRALGRLRGRFARECGDEDDRWIHALAPLAFGGGGDATKVALGELLGGALVSKTWWTVGVAAAVVALMAVGWHFLDGAAPSVGGADGEAEGVELPSIAAGDSAEDEVAPQELEATEEVEPARVALAAEVSPSGSVYVLTDSAERPIEKAELLLCRDGSLLARGETDAKGRFAPELEEGGTAQLLAIATGWPAQVHEVSTEAETQEVSLHEGAVLSGRIEVDGGRPADRIPLYTVADSVLLDFEEVLGAPAADFGVSGSLWRLTRTRADEDGSFRFDGLPLGWSGDFVLPSDYRLTDATLIENELSPWKMHVDEPVEQLRIEVTKRLALKGRVVDSRNGKVVPIQDVALYASIEYGKPPANSYYTPQTFTDPEGRFRFPLQDTVVRGGHLHLRTLDNTLSREVDLEPHEASGDWDLGDVPLVDPETTRTVQLLVRDPLGAPLPGAVAGMDVSSPVSEPTDADGRTSLRGVAPGGAPIVVYAVGYQVETVSVPDDVPEELVIDLKKGAGLELHFVTVDGESTRGLQVCLLAGRHPIREGEAYPASIHALIAAGCGTYHWARTEDEPGSLGMHTNRSGVVIANDLEPGVPLQLRVTARSGQLLVERDIAALAPAEWRSLDVELEMSPRALHGRVLDEAGKPVPGATVSMDFFPNGRQGGGSSSMSTGVEADGSFTLRGLYRRTVSFSIQATGYASLSIVGLELPADDTPVEFRLTSGHDVLVRVIDDAGRPVPARVRVRLDEESRVSSVRGAEAEVGSYLLRDLPAREVTIRARVHGVNYLRPHDPLVPEILIEVPALGSVEATLLTPVEVELDDNCHLWFLPEGDSEIVRRYGMIDLSGTPPVLLPDVLPGRYLAVVRRWHRPEEIPPELGDTWFADYPVEQFEEISPRVQVTVRPAETTRVDLWR